MNHRGVFYLFRQRFCTGVRWGAIALFLLALIGCRDASTAGQLRRLADTQVRVVWCRQVHGASDFFARTAKFKLMGFDTNDRVGERVILLETGSYHKPMLTSTGDQIVFTDVPSETIYAVNWNGSGLRELGSGLADEVWLDPVTGIEWVYRMKMTTSVRNPVHRLTRVQLDNPAIEEVVFSDVPLNADHIQLSQDGTYFCVQHPWPKIAALHVESGVLTKIGKGCWPAMAPNNSYLTWIFDGPHRNLIFHTLDGTGRWLVNINGALGVDGFEVYHPRWSNRDRFLCMTGPYRKGLYHGTPEVSVYVGRFNKTLTAVEGWVQISDHEAADFYPDVWVRPKKGKYRKLDVKHVGIEDAVDPMKERLVVKARLVERTQTPTLEEIAPYTQTLVVFRYELVEVVEGRFGSTQLLVAHWGIVNRKEKELSQQRGEVIQLTLEPYENRDELEGERLVMELSNMSFPLFYDLKGQ